MQLRADRVANAVERSPRGGLMSVSSGQCQIIDLVQVAMMTGAGPGRRSDLRQLPAGSRTASQSITSQSIASQSIASQSIAGESITSQSIAGESITSQSITGESITRQSITGESITSQIIA
jgi:hypothetical protein